MTRGITLVASLLALSAAAQAQMPDVSKLAGGLGKGALPDVSSMGAGNAAGVLSYCIKNKLIGGDASSVLGGLTKKPDVKGSDEYKSGSGGVLDLGGGKTSSLGGMPGKLKSQACDLVLKHGRSLL